MSRLVLRLLPVAAAAGLLAACSAMPEWTKPSTWVDGVTDAKKAPEAKAETKPAEAKETTQTAATAATADPVIDPLEPAVKGPRIKPAEKPTQFPNLAAQPAAREATTTESQRREIRDSLVADRDNAQHTADELRGGTAPAAAPPPPAPKTSATDKTDEDKPKSE